MAAFQFTNFANSTLASGISASATAITVASSDGALYPSSGDFQLVLTRNSDGAQEIIKCTSRSSDVLTCTREQEGTSGLICLTGDKIELRITAAVLATYIGIATDNTWTGDQTYTGDIQGATPFKFQGASDNSFRTTLAITDPTANRTLTMPDANVDLTLVKQATTTALGLAELATDAEVLTGTSTTRVPSVSSMRGGFVKHYAALDTSSGTNFEFEDIPEWVNEGYFILTGVSPGASPIPIIQVGDSSSYKAGTLYTGAGWNQAGGVVVQWTDGVILQPSGFASSIMGGIVNFKIHREGSTDTIAFHVYLARADANALYTGSGFITLTSPLTRMKLTTAAETVEYDAGAITLSVKS